MAFVRLAPMLMVWMALAGETASARAGDSPLHAWLVEGLCGAASEEGRLPVVLAPSCAGASPRMAGDAAAFERHDWPAAREARQRAAGYQRSTSFLVRRPNGRVEAVQTFDFGVGASDGGERRFGAFDAGRGDGGQMVTVEGDTAVIAMTEDGSGGVQWFTGSRCRTGAPPERSGWVLFSGEPRPTWTAVVAELRITRTEADCPTRFDLSYTRWRGLALDWPYLIGGQPREGQPVLPALDTVVSEHFGGGSVERADHLERFFLVRGVGLARWERWEQIERSRRPDVAERAERLDRSGRCPPLEVDAAPGPGWLRIDCRHWMNFVATGPAVSRAMAAPGARQPLVPPEAAAPATGFSWGRSALPGARTTP
jgi:hypothetical protein